MNCSIFFSLSPPGGPWRSKESRSRHYKSPESDIIADSGLFLFFVSFCLAILKRETALLSVIFQLVTGQPRGILQPQCHGTFTKSRGERHELESG